MTRVIYYTATTLNGYLADEQNSLQWLFEVEADDSLDTSMATFLADAGVLVEGSTTYLWVLDHEKLLEHPEKWQQGFFGDRSTFVFSSRDDLPRVPGADVTVLSGSVADAFPAIREAADDRDIWLVGGGDLAGQFADAGLLDELRITIAPATVAGGAPLLPRAIGSRRLRLTDVTRRGQFVELTYTLSALDRA
jgi:Dihydrofolate reductase